MNFVKDDKFLFRFFTGLVIAIVLIAALAPVISPCDPYVSNMKDSFLPPLSPGHLFGTDKLGRDTLTRILYGAQVSLSMALFVVFAITSLGSLIGIVAGYFGGKVDMILMRISDMMLAFPGIILAIAIAGMMGGSAVNTILALTVVGWTKYARLARGLTLKLKDRDFIAAAVTCGTKAPQMLWRHIVPNILPTIVVTSAMDIGTMIMEIAGLSFLGFGAQPPTAEWGLMLNEGRQVIQTAPWLMIFPGLAILIVVAVFNIWGDCLRDIMDPQRS